jgi:hypothetical protein
MFRWLLGALALISSTSCQASSVGTAHRAGESATSTEYSAQMRWLFDDELGGISIEGYATTVAPESRTLLSRRILDADSVLVCQIQTITEGSTGGETTSKLEFRDMGQSLASPRQEECPGLSVSRQSYSYLLIHHSSNILIGRTIVLFLRTFDDFGQQTLHWHGEPDSPGIRDEVKRIGSPIR